MTVKSTDKSFQVLAPEKIALTQPYKVQIKVTDKDLRKKANVINTHGCHIMNSEFEDKNCAIVEFSFSDISFS